MRKKIYARLYRKIVNEAYERYPEDSKLHRDMRSTFIKRMMVLEDYEYEQRKKFFFYLIQLLIMVLIVLCIVLL